MRLIGQHFAGPTQREFASDVGTVGDGVLNHLLHVNFSLEHGEQTRDLVYLQAVVLRQREHELLTQFRIRLSQTRDVRRRLRQIQTRSAVSCQVV